MVAKILYWEQKSQVSSFKINVIFPQTLTINEILQTSKEKKGVYKEAYNFYFRNIYMYYCRPLSV
jgi:hypothetical protein